MEIRKRHDRHDRPLPAPCYGQVWCNRFGHLYTSTSCHPDSLGQASEVIRSHRPLGLRWGPYTRALNAGIDDPPKEWRWWRWSRGRPRQTWLRTVENDVKQQNLGLWSARHRAYEQRRSCRGMLHDDDDDDDVRKTRHFILGYNFPIYLRIYGNRNDYSIMLF